ncbi:MAG TPA: PilZ domain-containing protein [Blastocatellia bacterium]|nr:PilZ domain-containing protein [Blastocatellia bacterium]
MSAAGMCATAKGREVDGSLRGRCEVNGSSRDCRVLNLTGEGAFVESFVPPVEGSKVVLHLQLPNGHMLAAKGLVSHHEFKSGFDVEFSGISSADREQLASLFA